MFHLVDNKIRRIIMADEVKNEQEVGAFVASLKRNNAKIRADRATAIAEDTQLVAEDTQLVYKRKIEDLELSIKKMQRNQENMLDLSPTDAQSLVLANEFDSQAYVDTDVNFGLKIRNTEIELEIAQKRYAYLFGGQ
jgi:hypothetical protein